tara:strand:+ start:444 stop:3692 length:3249 start_codon:yes stop_codon:yes gene_type:complete
MAVSHRTNRLKLIGTPAVEQLQNGRYQLTVNCTTMNSREDWYSANKDRVFPDFGSLESAEMSIDGLAPRTGEAYTDMRLVSVQSSTQQEKYIVTLVYQTLGASFVQVKDDTVNYIESGLRRVTRQIIAQAGTDFQKTVGTTSITSQIDDETAVTCILANYEVNDTDSYREVTEVYIEAGTLSETEDKVGSQLSIVKETFSSTPSTPPGYAIAKTEESSVDGLATKRFTFLKSNVTLSYEEDFVDGRNQISIEQFNGTPGIPAGGYTTANIQLSNLGGIPTRRFTFLKDDVQLSDSKDKVGSQLAIIEQWFKPAASRKVKANYSLAKEDISSVDGIPTESYTFLKNNVQLSRSVDNKSSLKTETIEYFKPDASKETLANYSLLNKTESNIDGIPTERYTFAKNNQELSKSVDNQSALKTETREYFNPESSRETLTDYSLINKFESDVDGIPTERYTFAKDNQQISKSVDNESPLKTEIREYFKPDSSEETLSGYSLVNKQESDADGIPTERYTFAKNNVTLSVTEDKVGSQNAIVNEIFNPSSELITGIDTDNVVLSGYSEADRTESNYDGIKTIRIRFLKDNVELSRSEDKVGSQLAIVTEMFNPTADPVVSEYSIAKTDESNVSGIPTKRFTLLKNNAQLSKSVDSKSSLKTEVIECFKPDSSRETLTGYSLVNKQESDVDGIPTERYTFSKNDVKLSESKDKVGSQLAITEEWFKPTSSRKLKSGYSVAKDDASDVGGIPTERYTFLRDNAILSRNIQTQNGGKLITEVVEVFNGIPTAETAGAVKIGDSVSNVQGIPTRRFAFVKGDGQIQIKTEGGPNSIPNSKIVTVVCYGSTAIVPDGILIDSQDEEQDGYKRFTRSCIQNTGSGDVDDITGLKYEYEDVEQVTVPGKVTLGLQNVSLSGVGGTIAVPTLEPIRQKQIPVKIQYEIVSSVNYPSTATARAYDLGQISCSVTSTKTSLKVGPGGSATVSGNNSSTSASGFTNAFSSSARIQTYPSCYISGLTSKTGNVTYTGASIPRGSGSIISFDNYTAKTQTQVIGSGSTSTTGYSTTGLLSVDVNVVLVSVDGSIYYGVTKTIA